MSKVDDLETFTLESAIHTVLYITKNHKVEVCSGLMDIKKKYDYITEYM